MKSLIKISAVACLAFVVGTSCSNDKEDWDDDHCLDPSYLVPLTVDVSVDKIFKEHLTIDTIFSDTTTTRATDMTPYLRYYVAAYPMTDSLPTVVASSYDSKVPIKIHPSRYTMVGWVMYESPDKQRSFNFYDDDFSELLLKNKYNYTGADIYKLAYRACEAKNIAHNTALTTLNAKLAMGQYNIIATDSADFTPDKVVVYYTSMLPASIHAKTGKINWWWSDISYTYPVTPKSDGSNLLASDFVLAQDDKDVSVTVTIEVYDEDGKLKARKKNVEIPLRNGGVTTIKGDFYSVLDLDKDGSAGSGIEIKTEWDASFDIAF